MNPPDGQLDAIAVERLLPRQHMLVDAIDKRPIEIEDECGFNSVHKVHKVQGFVQKVPVQGRDLDVQVR